MTESLTIRKYTLADLPRLKEITAICFGSVSIDENIEAKFGLGAGRDWRWRKVRHIDADTESAHADGVFVCEVSGQVCGYITTRIDSTAATGSIPNLAVLPNHQGKGVGRRLIGVVLDYMREKGVECARIETLEQNPKGQHLYSALGFVEVARQIHFAKRL